VAFLARHGDDTASAAPHQLPREHRGPAPAGIRSVIAIARSAASPSGSRRVSRPATDIVDYTWGASNLCGRHPGAPFQHVELASPYTRACADLHARARRRCRLQARVMA